MRHWPRPSLSDLSRAGSPPSQLALHPPSREHCGSGQLGKHVARHCHSRTSGRRKTLRLPGLQGTSHPRTEASAPARGTSREAFQEYSSHSSAFSWASTHLHTPMWGSPLVQATTWGPAMFPPGPNFAAAPLESHCLSLYTGEGELLEGRTVLQRCRVAGRGQLVPFTDSAIQVTERVASLGGRAPNLPREGVGE